MGVALLIEVAGSVRRFVCCAIVHLRARISSTKPQLNVLTISRPDWVDAENDKGLEAFSFFFTPARAPVLT